MHGGHSERRNGHFVLWLLVKMTKFPGLYERKVKGGVKINEHYGAKTKDKQSKRIDIKGLYRNKSSIPSSAPFYMFFPLGLILLPPTSLSPPHPLALNVTFGGVMWQRLEKRRAIMLS